VDITPRSIYIVRGHYARFYIYGAWTSCQVIYIWCVDATLYIIYRCAWMPRWLNSSFHCRLFCTVRTVVELELLVSWKFFWQQQHCSNSPKYRNYPLLQQTQLHEFLQCSNSFHQDLYFSSSWKTLSVKVPLQLLYPKKYCSTKKFCFCAASCRNSTAQNLKSRNAITSEVPVAQRHLYHRYIIYIEKDWSGGIGRTLFYLC